MEVFNTRKIFCFPIEEHYVDFEDSYKFEINNVYVNCQEDTMEIIKILKFK